MISLADVPARTKPLGLILYQGPSQLDGQPIVVIATGFRRRSVNEKTGDMVQVWILRADVSPMVAINTGQDESICGDCPLRGILERSADGPIRNRFRPCYVSVRNAPRAIYEAYQAGRYERYDAKKHRQLFRDRMIRFGAYGEPLAAPYNVWAPLLRVASGWTGYSHQWRTGRFWRFRRFLMASCETLAQAQEAQARGWRTFRSAPAGEATARGEIHCPASEERGKRTTCELCGACNGADRNVNRSSVLIWAHGSPATLGSYRRILDGS